MTANGALEGHARTLVEKAYGVDCGEAWPKWINEARAVLLHELSLEPTEEEVEAAAFALLAVRITKLGATQTRHHKTILWTDGLKDARAALKAAQDTRRQEIKDNG